MTKSWHDTTTPRLEGKAKAEKFERGRIMLKAKTRVISQSLAYMPDGPSMLGMREAEQSALERITRR